MANFEVDSDDEHYGEDVIHDSPDSKPVAKKAASFAVQAADENNPDVSIHEKIRKQ